MGAGCNSPSSQVLSAESAISKDKTKVWVFLMAGQSNMAGRGVVEATDTIAGPDIFSIDSAGNLVFAKEPLHFYEPTRRGLDCGLSFAQTLRNEIPSDIQILILPAAIGGSSLSQWLGDSLYRGVRLLSNFRKKLAIGKQYGTLHGILWHQGESDANPANAAAYRERLAELIKVFRGAAGDSSLPVLMGELASFFRSPEKGQINQALQDYSQADRWSAVIPTGDLGHKGDTLHFNSEGQRIMGQRFAKTYLNKFHR